MYKYIILFFIFLGTLYSSSFSKEAISYAIILDIKYSYSPQRQITFSWEKDTASIRYIVKKKLKNADSWQTLATIDSGAAELAEFTDKDIPEGIAYEYMFERWRTDFDNYAYTYAGEKTPFEAYRGKILLLIDSTVYEPLRYEINRLKEDIEGDGWQAIIALAPRTEKFSPAAVAQTKQIIDEEYKKDSLNLKAVFIIGRIAVPYSGLSAVDGHTIHEGAWPSDLYYGTINGVWTDTAAAVTKSDRTENHNFPGDGKFDQSTFLQDVKLQVGRVDFYNLPHFKETELELLKRYMDKNHAYRNKEISVRQRALISDGFGDDWGTPFAAGAWYNFTCIVGRDSIVAGDFRHGMENEEYLFAYGCHQGDYNNIYRTAYSNELASLPYRSVFTCLFGSYAGDWDSENNVMRAAIASQPTILTCAWDGRPFWLLHLMGLGETIGYSTLLSQNNKYLYLCSGKDGFRMTHTALMGDPTLRAGVVAPVSNLRVTEAAINKGKRQLRLNWDASPDDILGYNIYRAENIGDKFEKINSELITENSYFDERALLINNAYMVRAVKLEKTPTGSYFNESRGVFVDYDFHTDSTKLYYFILPNPVNEKANIYVDLPEAGRIDIEVFDLNGKLISRPVSGYYNSGSRIFSWYLNDSYGKSVAPGVYYLRLTYMNIIKTNKITVIP